MIFLGYGIGREVLRLPGIFMKMWRFSKENVKEKYIFNGNKTLYIGHGQKSLFRSLIYIEFQLYGSYFVFSNTVSCMFGCIYVRLGKQDLR